MGKIKKEKQIPIDITGISVESIPGDEDNIELVGTHNAYSISMYLYKDPDPTYFSRFIKSVERVVRGNKDYEIYLDYLREEKNLNTCSIFHNIQAGDASIELHHFPFTLYTLCSITASKLLKSNLKVSTFIVADEVIKLHFKEVVGLVPLTVTMHELAHSNSIKLSSDMIFGDYHAFMQEYDEYIPEDKKLEISNMEQKSLFNKDYYAKINSVTLDINPSIFSDDEDEDLSTKEIDEFFDDGNS